MSPEFGAGTHRQVCPDDQFPEKHELWAGAPASWVQQLHSTHTEHGTHRETAENRE
jgi:hypothetical protein